MKQITANMPLVSVLIGTYNRADLLLRAVNSVLRQHYGNLEIIVIDDASTDNTPEVVRTLGDDRVKYIRHKENKGIATVSNAAFKHSKGEFIALLGDDDEWTNRDKLYRQVEVFRKNRARRLGIVGAWWQDIENGQVIRQHTPDISSDLTERMLTGNIICGSMMMVSRKAWEAVGGFNENMKRGTDSELARSIITRGYEVEMIPEIMGNVHISGSDRITNTNSLERIKTAMCMVEYLLQKYSALYDKYPQARAHRLYQLAELSLNRYILRKEKSDLNTSYSYLKKAFDYKVMWKPIIKWLICRLFGSKPLLLYKYLCLDMTRRKLGFRKLR